MTATLQLSIQSKSIQLGEKVVYWEMKLGNIFNGFTLIYNIPKLEQSQKSILDLNHLSKLTRVMSYKHHTLDFN